MKKEKLDQQYGKYNVILKYFNNDTDAPTYISNYITEKDVDDWKESQPIFISAQTGSGKNTFVKNVLIKWFDKKNYQKKEHNYFLYLVNRTALKEQLKYDLKESLKTETIEDYDKFIYVYTYQELISKILEKKSEVKKLIKHGKIKYVVMDECHFFLSDAVFNPHTHFLLKYLIMNLSKAMRVYMSATLEDVSQVILELEYKDHPCDFSCLYYYFERKFNYIENIYVYSKFSEIENIVKETLERYSDQKFMIFVTSKDDGYKLIAKLKSINISCEFITSETKSASTETEEYKEYRHIVEKEKFLSQVLISTSVLDNGVTIKDNSVNNIVIDVFDRVEMLQMLGRIRVKKHQKINIYIRVYKFYELEEMYNKNISELLLRLKLDKLQSEYEPAGTFDLLIKSVGSKFINVFRMTDNPPSFDYNKCAIYQLTFKTAIFREILSIMSHKDYSINPQNLNYEENRTRSNFYGKYTKTDNYTNEKYSREWAEFISRELELETEKTVGGSRLSDAISYSFFKYLCLTIPYLQTSYFLRKMGYNPEPRILEQPYEALKILQEKTYLYIDDDKHSYRNNFERMFELFERTNLMYLNFIKNLETSPFPALEVQLMWLGRNRFDPSVKYVHSTLKILALSEDEIETMMNLYKITSKDYEKHASKDLKHSGNNLYYSFDNPALIREKGILNREVKNGLTEINENKPVPDLIKIIYWLIGRYRVQAKNVMESLVKKMEQQPFVGSNCHYTIRLVRENVKPQDYYYILVAE